MNFYKDDNIKKPNSHSLWERTRYVFCLMTIEPMVMIQGIAQYIIEVPQSQMLLYKTCRGQISCHQFHIIFISRYYILDPIFNMTEEFCSSIEDHAVEGTIYDDIEEATVRDHSQNIFPLLSDVKLPTFLFLIFFWRKGGMN